MILVTISNDGLVCRYESRGDGTARLSHRAQIAEGLTLQPNDIKDFRSNPPSHLEIHGVNFSTSHTPEAA